MIEVIQIGKTEVQMKASGNTPKLYREIFKKEFFADLKKFRTSLKQTESGGFELSEETDTGVLERLGYVMAYQAHADHTGSIEEWLDQFGPFDIIGSMGAILSVWGGSEETTSTP